MCVTSERPLPRRIKPPIHQTYLSGVEGGKRNPTVVVLDRIAGALGVHIEDLTKKW